MSNEERMEKVKKEVSANDIVPHNQFVNNLMYCLTCFV